MQHLPLWVVGLHLPEKSREEAWKLRDEGRVVLTEHKDPLLVWLAGDEAENPVECEREGDGAARQHVAEDAAARLEGVAEARGRDDFAGNVLQVKACTIDGHKPFGTGVQFWMLPPELLQEAVAPLKLSCQADEHDTVH